MGRRPARDFLVAGPQLREMAEAAGFTPLLWNQGEGTLASIASAARDVPVRSEDRGIGLHLLMPEFEARMAGLSMNVAERRIELVQAVSVAR
jgi:hypothetical protein